MLRTVSLLVVVAVVGFSQARPGSSDDLLGLFSPDEVGRAVPNPKTPNQILDAVIEGAVDRINAKGWDSSKNVQNGETAMPLSVDNNGEMDETFKITEAYISGLGSLRRSKSGSFNSDQTVLSGSMVAENVCVHATYTLSFPGTGEAPAHNTGGKLTECDFKIFADLEINIDGTCVQSIKSYSVRSGHDELSSDPEMSDNMANIETAGMRKALKEILEDTMARNVKVQVNQSIQELETQCTA